MIAPSSAPAAGLGALAKPATSTGPRGMPAGNMQQIMNTARKMSDAQLAEVLSGKSLDVPQYVAMTEAMGRKQLRTAMQGAQAQQAANQPSIKEKLMGEYAQEQAAQAPQMPQGGGIASIPAPTMAPEGMAGGGIVAFNGEDGSEVEDEQTRRDRAGTSDILDMLKDYGKALGRDTLTLPGRALGGAYNTVNRGVRSLGIDSPYIPESFFSGDSSSMAPNLEAVARRREAASNVANPVSQGDVANRDAYRSAPAGPSVDEINALNARPKVNAPGAGGAGGAGGGGGKKTGMAAALDGETDSKKAADDYFSKLLGLSDKQREGIASIRNQGQGELLLNLAAAAFGTPNMNQMMAKGLPLVSSGAASIRKDIRDVEKTADDYDLTLAKYREAVKSGDQDRALKLKQILLEDKYHMAMANKPDSGLAMLNALKNPENMDIYRQMKSAAKGEVYSIDKATDDFNKIVADKFSDQAKRLKAAGITSPYAYQQYVLSQGGGGGGTDLQSQAAAELARRKS